MDCCSARSTSMRCTSAGESSGRRRTAHPRVRSCRRSARDDRAALPVPSIMIRFELRTAVAAIFFRIISATAGVVEIGPMSPRQVIARAVLRQTAAACR